MKILNDELLNIVTKKIASAIGETSIKVGENASCECVLLGIYEPKFPTEILLQRKK